ncbi:tRNA (guanine-N7)-methyltransferase [Deinococcus sonorensis]|uniref:tRNA (guanine-N(7)-)-methyltransferase n=2 Tax=Deinococcus sonorensis TaxID=309891 RepID=A0AAU7U7J3_9DEIO
MILRLQDLHFPEEAARLFPDTPDRALYLEIGFGDGRFWPAFVEGLPDVPNYLGVELSGVSLLKAARRLRAAGLRNAHVAKLPATVMLESVIAPGRLSGIIVNFPDPWPKADHLDQRLLRAPFFRLAASRLKPGGAVLFTTDHQEYFEFACREAEASGVMEVRLEPPPAAALATKYALKWRDLGIEAQHARFVPTAHPAVPLHAVTPYPDQEAQVPHAIMTLPDPFDLSDFERVTVRGEHHTVVLLDAYRSLRRDEYTVLAHVEEGELIQEVLVNVTGRRDGSTLVRLAKFGGPVITAGVKAAVGAVADELQRRGAVLTHHGY